MRISFLKSLQRPDHLIQRRAIKLIGAAIDIVDGATAIDNYSGWACDVDCIVAQRVMESVSFGHSAILVEQKNAGDRMLLEKVSRPPHAVSFFRRNKRQLCSTCFNFRSSGLELSHAPHAV